MVKEIKLIAKTFKTKEGKPFTSFKAVQKDGTLVDCKFRQKGSDNKPIVMPSASCIMVIDSEHLSFNRTKQYPVLWVREQPKEYKETTEGNTNVVDKLF